MTRQCAACSKLVARRDCHKNRYAEYICHACQATGIRFTPQGRRRHWMRRLRLPLLAGLALLGLLVLLLLPYLMTSDVVLP